jgi:hypothetical protein
VSLKLDRMALEDVGAEPQRQAEAILAQMRYRNGPVPIEDVACALGIGEIRQEPLNNFEGALLTDSNREFGSILINSNAPIRRRRFTLGHELGHFLNPHHLSEETQGFFCSTADMREAGSAKANRHRRQETEANRFAIEILAPRTRCRALFNGDADLAEVLAMVKEFDISREAAARRYVELHEDAVAVMFTKEGRLIYSALSDGFPARAVRKGDLLRLPPEPGTAGVPTEMGYVDATFWVDGADGELLLQTLFQKEGYAISLLRFIPNDEEEPEIEDAYQRFAKFNHRE